MYLLFGSLTRSGNAGGNSRIVLSYISEEYGINNRFKFSRVNGSLFHDIFEVNGNYLSNGEHVDLYENYDYGKCLFEMCIVGVWHEDR